MSIYIHMYAYHIYHALTSAWPLVTADNGSVMAAKVLPFHALSLEKKIELNTRMWNSVLY